VSHPKILPPDEGSSPSSANWEQIIDEEHGREMLDILEHIRECVRMGDQRQISSTGWPALTYFIARQQRQMSGRRQHRKHWILFHILTVDAHFDC